MGYKSRNHYAQGESITQKQWDDIFKKESDGGSSAKTGHGLEGTDNSKDDDRETEESESKEESRDSNHE